MPIQTVPFHHVCLEHKLPFPPMTCIATQVGKGRREKGCTCIIYLRATTDCGYKFEWILKIVHLAVFILVRFQINSKLLIFAGINSLISNFSTHIQKCP